MSEPPLRFLVVTDDGEFDADWLDMLSTNLGAAFRVETARGGMRPDRRYFVPWQRVRRIETFLGPTAETAHRNLAVLFDRDGVRIEHDAEDDLLIVTDGGTVTAMAIETLIDLARKAFDAAEGAGEADTKGIKS